MRKVLCITVHNQNQKPQLYLSLEDETYGSEWETYTTLNTVLQEDEQHATDADRGRSDASGHEHSAGRRRFGPRLNLDRGREKAAAGKTNFLRNAATELPECHAPFCKTRQYCSFSGLTEGE